MEARYGGGEPAVPYPRVGFGCAEGFVVGFEVGFVLKCVRFHVES